jgi:hypothetical protein
VKEFLLNKGAQESFVNSPSRYVAYIGGVGAGKTFAGIARGLKFSFQPPPPGALYGPRGVVAAVTHPVLADVVLPEFFRMVDGTDILANYVKSEKKAYLTNGAEILFRSLDRPNWMRGLDLSWFFIDEGRHLTRSSWDVLVGRLRQGGYHHSGWVCSTPNGYDWMWELFHEDSPKRLPTCEWHNAPTYENKAHLPASYLEDLQISYTGKLYEQEVEGRFVGLMSGSVFPHFDTDRHLTDVPYDPTLPLYSFWDYGIGDMGVILWAQVAEVSRVVQDHATGKDVTVYVPELHIIDYEEAKDRSSSEWAEVWREWLAANVGGRTPRMNIGDPAGAHRNLVSGDSYIDALLAQGIVMVAPPRKPVDYAIRILDQMMADDRVLVDATRCARVGAAISTYHYPTDDSGNRTGAKPVHDWTSHHTDALRYGATMLFSHFPRREKPAEPEPPGPGTYGELFERATRRPEYWLGREPETDLSFVVTSPVGGSR